VIVSKNVLKSFILTYWDKLNKLVLQVKQSYPTIDLNLVFPQFVIKPFYIRGIISRRHGVAIEFIKPANKITIEVIETDKEVEEVVLPRLSEGIDPIFHIKGLFTVIEGLNIISEDFYKRYKDLLDVLSRVANIIAKSNLGYVVKVTSGDVKLIDISVAYMEKGQYKVRKIPFLWIFGTNDRDQFKIDVAEAYAVQDFQRYLYRLAPHIPIEVLLYIVEEYEKLITKEDVKEEEVLNFLYRNPFILISDCIYIEKKPPLNHEHVPDFIVQTSTGYFIVVELESPRKKLFTKEKGFPEHKDLKNARAQIERYLEFVKNNILYLKQRYPDITAEKIRGLLVIGLKSNMTKDEIARLKTLNSHLHDYEIATYDELSDRIKTLAKLLLMRFGLYI